MLKCEEVFIKIKEFLLSPLILTCRRGDSPLLLYLSVTEWAMRLILSQEIDKAEKLFHFIRKVFKDAKMRYQKIEKLVLSVFTASRKLWPYL